MSNDTTEQPVDNSEANICLSESSSSFYSLSSSSADDFSEEELDPEEFELNISSTSKWSTDIPEKWEIIQTMMGGSLMDFEELEGSFDGARAMPPDPPLDAYVTTREISPPRPPEYVKNFRSQREVIHPLL